MASAFQKLLENLTGKIRSGFYTVGAVLPSENELCVRFSLSRPTVRRVLAKLCEDGLVEKRPGIGTFVTDPERQQKEFLSLPFHVGSNCLFENAPHYSDLILRGMSNSRFGKNFYMKPVPKMVWEQDFPIDEIDGFFLRTLPENPDFLLRSKKPVILCNNVSPYAEIASVRVDHYGETRRGIEYLLRYGARRIALVGGMTTSIDPVTQLRTRGFMDQLHESGIELSSDLLFIHNSNSSPEDDPVIEFIRRLECDAVFCVNGSYFRQFISYWKLFGQEKNKNTRFLVFDDVTSLMAPGKKISCAYIKMPLEEMGAEALEYLRRKAHDPEYPVLNKIFPCQLVINHA